jgi:hypothetical protein
MTWRDEKVSKIEPVPLFIHLPPLAHLPRTREVLHDLCNLLDRALVPIHRFKRVRADLDNDLKLAVGFLAMNGLAAARAVHTLSGTEHAGTATLYFRVVFEVLVKIRWMRKDLARARAYLQSEPFERYILATDRVKKSKRWAAIVKECADEVATNLELLQLPKVNTGKNNPPNFKAIARALRMPSLDVMAKDIGMDEEDYLLHHGLPSLFPHTSVVHVKNFAKTLNADGSVNCSTTVDPTMLLGYVARTATRTGEVLNQVLEVWPDGATMFESEKVAKRLSEIVEALRVVMPSPNE